jgi:hypothetical protein
LSIAQATGIDSSTSNLITANSTLIDLIIPSTSTEQKLTLIKNAYYNSENLTHVNYTLTVEVVNSGGEDLININLLDTDLSLNTLIDLNRTQSYNYSNFTILEKAASNTNKLFDKSTAIVNTITYESNQLQVRIPGYGGPADAIVYSPSSVPPSTDFQTTITVKNMNQYIGQDFTIDYWITSSDESTNYSSGQQTIYVPYSGESNFTATLLSPSSDGEYKLKTLVTWVGGTAPAYDSFLVITPAIQTSTTHSSGGSVITTKAITSEVVCNVPYIRYELGCCLDKNNNNICDVDDIKETNNEIVNQTVNETEEFIQQISFKDSISNFIQKGLTQIKNLFLKEKEQVIEKSKIVEINWILILIIILLIFIIGALFIMLIITLVLIIENKRKNKRDKKRR